MRGRLLVLLIAVVSACSGSVTVSGDGGPLTLTDRPRRIVSLSASHTEILYAIGAADRVVATDLTSDFPPEAAQTAKVDAFNFNVEEIASHDPDLVVTAFDFQGEVEALEMLDIPVLLLGPPADLEGAYDQIETLGEVTRRRAEATELVRDMRSRIDSLIATVAGTSLTFFHEVDSTLFTANSSTFLGDIYRRVGLDNLADDVPDAFGSGYVQLSEEYLLSADPDLIFLGDAGFGESAVSVSVRPGWDTLTAVRNGHVVELDGDIAGRWGPRTVELVEQVVRAVAEAR